MSFADRRLFFLSRSCRGGTCFLARPRKQAKKSPGMRFPVPDSRRIGKSHIPGSADFTLLRHQERSQEYFLNLGLIICLSPTGVCFSSSAYAAGAPVSPDASCRRGTFFFGRAKKKAKNSPGMRFPVPDSGVGPRNRTFPVRQSLPVLRVQSKASEEILI